MGKLTLSTSMTVDSVMDVAEWFVAEGDHNDAARDRFAEASAMLIGRKNYEGFVGYWPSQTGEWADIINPMPKYVASRTLSGPLEWNSTLIEGDVAEEVARLKDELPGDLAAFGAGEFARFLVDNGLVDELRFGVHPTVWGDGARPFSGQEPLNLELLGSESYDSGVVLLRYRPA